MVEEAHVIQLASIAFDASVSEIAMSLCVGATLVIAPRDQRSGEALEDFIQLHAITHATFTPTVLSTFSPTRTSTLRSVIVAGEASSDHQIAKWRDTVNLFNAYGPTESTVCATMSGAIHVDGLPTVGKPLSNTRVYVLDDDMHPCPIGVVGELYIAGAGLARGYWKQPALTAQRFIANPFASMPGQRLYRTGDYAKWDREGNLHFHGRADAQVKIRGFRIEPAEIEAALLQIPYIKQAAVIAHSDESGTKALTAYLAIDSSVALDAELTEKLYRSKVQKWHEFERETFLTRSQCSEARFDTTGWDSSYTGEPLPNVEMEEYVATSIERILSLQPQRVFEIGCGSGLLLFRLTPHCTRYTGIDFSSEKVERLSKQLENHSNLPSIKVACHEAIDLRWLEAHSYDTVVLPSVVQYFPGMDYLMQVLEGVFEHVLVSGGSLFIGDIRNRRLQKAFYSSVELFKSGPHESVAEIARRVEHRLQQEAELTIDPSFFLTLPQFFPQIRHVEISPKRGEHHNELTCFRYDVILRTVGETVHESSFEWQSWNADTFSLENIRLSLTGDRPSVMALRSVTNARLAQALHSESLLTSDSAKRTVSEVRKHPYHSCDGIDPETLWSLADELGYQADLSLAPAYGHGAYDALLRRKEPTPLAMPSWEASDAFTVPAKYGNDPLVEQRKKQLLTTIRQTVEQTLPSYMVPVSFVLMESLPLTISGKLDRKALPMPQRAGITSEFLPARDTAEGILCGLVAELLKLDRVGISDNFFHLGGDSISSIRLVSRARELGIVLTPRDIFLHPVIGELVVALRGARIALSVSSQAELSAEGIVTPTPIMRRLFSQALSWKDFCQCVTVTLPQQLNTTALEAALRAVISHHDALRLRCENDQTLIVAPARDIEAQSILHYVPAVLSDAGCGAFQAVLDGIDPRSQLVNAVLTKHPAEGNSLLLAIHHLAIDAVSWSILIADLEMAYSAAAAGRRITLPSKTTSFRHWAEKLALAPNNYRSELPLWKAMTGKGSSLLPHGFEMGNTTVSHVLRNLSTEATSELLTRALSTYHARIPELLIAGLAIAIAAWKTDQSSIYIDVESHGRESSDESIDLSRTVGWFTALYPLHLDLGNICPERALTDVATAGRVIRAVKEQLRRVPSNGIGYGVLRYLDIEAGVELERGTEPQISFNYMGRSPMSESTDVPWQPVRGTDPTVFRLDHPLSINATTRETLSGPTLETQWSYSPDLLSLADAERLADLWNEALTAITLHARVGSAMGFLPSDTDLVSLSVSEVEMLSDRYEGLEDVWSLTPLQEGLLFHAQYDCEEEEDPYLVQLVFELDGALDPLRLRAAMDALLERHASLRVAFWRMRGGQPVQVVCRQRSMPWVFHDLREIPSQQQRATQLEAEDRRLRFALDEAPLMRCTLLQLGSERFRLLFTQHHLLGDGWSGAVLLEDLLALYRHQGQLSALAPQPSFRQYLRWLKQQDQAAAEQAWRSYLDGIETPTLAAPALQAQARMVQAQYEESLTEDFTSHLETAARRHGLTLATLLEGAWALLLSRMTGQRDVVFGIVSSGRHALVPGIERMLGLLITTTPVRVPIHATDTVLDLLTRLQQDQATMLEHQHLPLTEIQRATGVDQLFDTLFTYENYPIVDAEDHSSNDDLPLREIRGHNSNHYPLSLAVLPGAKLGLRLHYSSEAFDAGQIRTLATKMVRLLEQIVANPLLRTHEIDALLPEERRKLLELFNDTDTPLPPVTLAELFEAQAARTPHHVAVRYEGEALTYAELEARSNQLAWRLIGDGAGPEEIVALRMQRGVEMIVAILATLKAGAAYLPLDPDAPVQRNQMMLEDTQPITLLQSPLPDTSGYPVHPPQNHNRTTSLLPQHPAYLIYTSGSSGKPKAVSVTHQGVTRLFDSIHPWYRFSDSDVCTMFHTYAFDFSVSEMWGALLHGGQLVIVPREVGLSGSLFRRFIAQYGITVLNQTTRAFQNLIDSEDSAVYQYVPRVVIFGGESCPPDLANRWSDRCMILHAYGPTETTVFATMTEPLRDVLIPNLGKPLSNTRVYVLDDDMDPCPIGVVGELYIAGAGLARGYWKQPALTAQRFVAHPFSTIPGQRLYRTGDYAKWDREGNLHFHGRADAQVKIRGFRIEPAEIEAALLQIPYIKQAAVIAKEATEKRFIAYVVAQDDVDLALLRSQLADHLPEYMIPTSFVRLAELPLTPNNKLDTAALPKPDEFGISASYLAPTTPDEAILCEIVAELLNIKQVGLADNFFHLGGHSLMAGRLASMIRCRLGRQISLQSIFESPNLNTIAQRIANHTAVSSAFEILLPIRPGGTKTPLFCLHPGTGLCWAYSNLLSILPADQPVYGIQARGFTQESVLAESLQDIVEECLSNIRFTQPVGPYRLLGWSFGGVLSHMIATQLQTEGQEVEQLILFDSFPPTGQEEDQVRESIWIEIARGTNLAMPIDLPSDLTAEFIHILAQEQSHILGTFTVDELKRLARVLAQNSRLVTTARLQLYKGDMTVFIAQRATPGLDRSHLTANAWKEYCTGSIFAVDIDAEHHQMMSSEALRQVGDLLK